MIPERLRFVVDDLGVAAIEPGRRLVRIAWNELRMVAIVSNDGGPTEDELFFVLHGTAGRLLTISHDESIECGLLPVLQRLPGFDHAKLSDASCCTEHGELVCWTWSGAADVAALFADLPRALVSLASGSERRSPATGAVVGDRALGDISPPRETAGQRVTTIEIGRDGLRIRAVQHLLPYVPPMPCVSLITDGLRQLGRDEMCLTVPVAVLADGPHVPARFMKSLASGLDNAPRMGPGTFIAVTIPEWPHVTGFALERTWPMDGVELPMGCLTLHALVGPELEAAGAVGPLRILARLGSRAHFWPTPAWCDPRRAAVAEPTEATFLAKVRTGHFPNITVTLEDRTIVVRAARSALPRLADLADLDPREPFVLFTSLDQRADALFSWRPGEEVASAHTLGRSPGARIAGCFFAVFPNRRADGGAVAEDGLRMSFTAESTERFRDALLRGEPFRVPSGRSYDLRLEWSGELA